LNKRRQQGIYAIHYNNLRAMEHAPKHPFMRSLAARNVPLRLRFELTRRCNLACVHCKVHCDDAPEGELNPEEIAMFLDQARNLGTMEIGITGGEVFTRPDIADILEKIFEKDFLLHIQTNAAAITADHVRLLAANRKKILRVSISIYAADAAVHDHITGVPGSHAKTLNALFALREAGVPIFCFTLLFKDNVPHVDALKRFYIENDLPHQFNTFIIPRHDGCAAPLDRRVPPEFLADLPVDWYGYLNPDGTEDPALFHADATLEAWCPVGRFAVITAQGDVIPCSLLRESAGNIRNQPLREIWENAPALKRVRDIRLGQLACFSCEKFPVCKPCVGLSYLEHGDLFARPTEICRLTNLLLKSKNCFESRKKTENET
jgi:AdoMet-dependent heme synthase